VLEEYMTAHVAGMQLFRTNKQLAFKAIGELPRQNNPMILECTYDMCSKQYVAIDGLPLPWQSGFDSMITGFPERFSPHGTKNRGALSSLDPLRAENRRAPQAQKIIRGEKRAAKSCNNLIRMRCEAATESKR
jgi:hypothetical protein